MSANTKYWVVVDDVEQEWGFTYSTDQATGWSIDDINYRKNSLGIWERHALDDRGRRILGLSPDVEGRRFKVGFLGRTIPTAPSFATKPLTFIVNENAASGAVVGTAGATDADGDPLMFTVSGADAAAFGQVFALSAASGEITVKEGATVDHESKDSYAVTISVTDGEDAAGVMEGAATVDDTVALTITVTDIDEPGMVALSRATPAVGKSLTAALTDPDGGVTGAIWTWAWSTTSSGSFTTISGASTATYTPVQADVGRFLKATVSYTDSFGSGKSAQQVSDNTVLANPPPVFADDSLTFTVNENATAGTVGTVTADDPDGETITYSVGGVDVAAFNEDFSMNASTGVITVKSDATIDFEGKPSYSVTVTAADPFGGDDTVAVTINVTDVDDPGMVALSRATPAVGKSLTATLTDPDGGVTGVIWTWSWSTTRNGNFTTISGASTATYTPVQADVGRFLRATVSYTDSFGSGKSAERVSDNTVLANPPPVFASASLTFTVNENATAGTVGTVTATDPDGETITYSVGGIDVAAFNEDFSMNASTGVITVKSDATIDHESKPSYSVTVTATDPFGGADTVAVTINVTDVDETGMVALSRATPAVGKSLTAALTDPDGGVTGAIWTWAWSTTSSGSFSTISGANSATYTPVQADVGRFLRATASYTDAFSSGKSVSRTADNATVSNPPPEFAHDSYTFTVNENATAGTVGTVTADDPDDETITYSAGGADEMAFNEDFSLNASTGVITVKSDATIDHESKPSYSVTVTAADPYGGDDTVAVTITVADIDEPGMVALSSATPAVGIPLTAALSDSDGVAGATWSWSSASTRTGGFSTIPGANIATYTPVQADVGRYLKATVSYTDSFSSGKSAGRVSDNTVLANPPPVFADDSVTLTVNENATAGTVGTVTATDPDGETITYSVGGIDVAAFNENFSLNASTGVITVNSDATIDHESKPSYTVAITAMDPAGGTSTINVTINVSNVDELGTVTLSRATPAVGRPLTATLTDPDGGVAAVTWSWSSASTRTGSFSIISGANRAIYTPVTGDVGRFLKATANYTDSFGSGKSASQSADNEVVTNPPPVFAHDTVTFTVNENATAGIVGTVTAIDPDGETITYSAGGIDVAAFNEDFSLNTSTGVITVKSDASIDHESRPSYSVTITAADPSVGIDTISVTINVTDLDESGTVALSRATPALGRTLTATLTDPDGGVTGAIWTWSWSTTRDGSFTTISGASTATYTPVQADVGRFLKATVSYTDSFSSGKTASQTADNAVVTNPPPVFAADSVTFTVDENATTGIVGTVTATDPDGEAITYSVGGGDVAAFNGDFSLNDSTGEIAVKSNATIDHETKPSYSVRITARDPSGGTDTISVTINVTDVDDPGTVALSRATPAVGRSLTATLTDPDGGVTGATWTWAWSTTRNGSFTTISGASAPTYTPASGDLGRYLKASVSYSDSFGSGKNAEMTSTNAVVANPPPVFASASYTFRVYKNATSGRVGRVRATDPDGDTITYSVAGVDVAAFNADFSLNTSTGVITVKSDATIDQESKPSYSVTITATDPFGGADTVAVTINVTDVALAPPVNVQASVTDERVALTWQGNVSNFQVDGYRIERYEGHSSGWETLEPFLPAVNKLPWDNPDVLETYIDTDVLPSAPYRYRIWSMNDSGPSSRYAGVAVETAVDPPELRIHMETGQVTIGWDAPEDDSITGYRILRRVQWGPEETLVSDTGPGVTGWVDRQVLPDTAYAYRLQALHDGQPGARSRYLFALTPRIATPTVVVSELDGQDLAASTETIGRIDVGGSVTGTIDSLDDRDWFAVEMEAGEAYQARLRYMTEDGLRPFANGRVVLGCLMDADGTDSPDRCLYKGRVEFEVQQAGTYYIVVQPRWYQADLGHPEMPTEYELELDHDVDLPQDSSIPPPYGALRTSSEVEVGTWVSGDLHNGDRADNHRVHLQQGHWYRVPVFFDYGPDADGVVANAGAVRIGTGHGNSRWSHMSPHLFRASQTGTHYLNVAREADISTVYATQHTYYFREATYKFLVEDLGTLDEEEATTSQGQRANSPATGGPGIIGTVRAGETLTATTDGIEDEDGLTGADFAYQWVRHDLATFDDTDIEGATGSTYTVTDADEGKAIKVRVSFTDDAGNEESLTSNARLSAPPLVILEPETPLTATIHDAPESHDGQTDFTFELRFTEEPKEDFSYETLKDHAFTVTGGEVDGARRLDGNSDTPNIRWEITVSPDSNADVTVVLPATTDCEADGAVCTDDGRMLSGELELTVSGPDSQQQAVDEAAPELRSAVVDGAALTLTYDEDLNTDVTPPASAFAVNVDGASRSIDSVSASGAAVTLALATAVEAGDTVTVDYTVPTGESANRLQDTSGNTAASFSGQAVTNSTSSGQGTGLTSQEEAANSPATGRPGIIGSVRAGETLTATTDDIEDEDGLEGAVFAYQWLHHDLMTNTDTDIRGARGSTYTVTDEDEAIKVRVSFTDAAGNEESLTSYFRLYAPPQVIPDEEAPESGEAQETPLTAAIHDAPESHDGTTDFTFELRFSEEPKEDFSYETLKDHAFTVTGGEVDGARRLDGNSDTPNIRWEITVSPDSNADVTVVLPATTDCEADGAVCTDDGRMLSEGLELTVSGPDSQQQAANTPATGGPAISGTARVGETLTADTSGIADEDGLTNVSSYQWVADDTDIDGATDSTYTLSEDDVGKTINVRVTFTDDAGNEESLTSAATATAAARPSLTASVLNAPQSHNGSDDFTFRITFSEELETDFSYTTLKDHAFTVTGGTVAGARRLVSGSNVGWEITVSPHSNGDVTVTLPATEGLRGAGGHLHRGRQDAVRRAGAHRQRPERMRRAAPGPNAKGPHIWTGGRMGSCGPLAVLSADSGQRGRCHRRKS